MESVIAESREDFLISVCLCVLARGVLSGARRRVHYFILVLACHNLLAGLGTRGMRLCDYLSHGDDNAAIYGDYLAAE